MKTTPWAKLTMRMMPKISVGPHAIKNRIEACESALRHCARMKPNQFIGDLARTLVSRFRRSYPFASRTHTNVGTKGTLATNDSSVALDLTFLRGTRGNA